MRVISALIFAVFLWGFQFGMDQSVHKAVKKVALTKVDTGLGSLALFTSRLTDK